MREAKRLQIKSQLAKKVVKIVCMSGFFKDLSLRWSNDVKIGKNGAQESFGLWNKKMQLSTLDFSSVSGIDETLVEVESTNKIEPKLSECFSI